MSLADWLFCFLEGAGKIKTPCTDETILSHLSMQGEFFNGVLLFLSDLMFFLFYIVWRQIGVSGVKPYQNFTHLYSFGFTETQSFSTNKRRAHQYNFDPAGM
ncbi:MAG: hypothetical protein UGE23_11955 [Peptococcaceae bacterium]|nr:hypothetical protein [Peptococcaceae bacterium]